MQTVETIIKSVYGGEEAAAREFGVTRSAICNYKARGHFPARLVVKIFNDAKAQRYALDLDGIPTIRAVRAA